MRVRRCAPRETANVFVFQADIVMIVAIMLVELVPQSRERHYVQIWAPVPVFQVDIAMIVTVITVQFVHQPKGHQGVLVLVVVSAFQVDKVGNVDRQTA